MILNLDRMQRKVLLLLQREGPMDTDLIADHLSASLIIARRTVEALTAEDLVTSPDGSVAELTEYGEKYNLLRDESIEGELDSLKGCRADVLQYIQETDLHPITPRSLALHLNCTDGEISDALDALEEAGYPVKDIVS